MLGVLKKILFGVRGARVSPQEAVAYVNGGAALVDVREKGEFARGHAPAGQHGVERHLDRHQGISSSSACNARAWSTKRASSTSAAPTTPSTMPERSKYR